MVNFLKSKILFLCFALPSLAGAAGPQGIAHMNLGTDQHGLWLHPSISDEQHSILFKAVNRLDQNPFVFDDNLIYSEGAVLGNSHTLLHSMLFLFNNQVKDFSSLSLIQWLNHRVKFLVNSGHMEDRAMRWQFRDRDMNNSNCTFAKVGAKGAKPELFNDPKLSTYERPELLDGATDDLGGRNVGVSAYRVVRGGCAKVADAREKGLKDVGKVSAMYIPFRPKSSDLPAVTIDIHSPRVGVVDLTDNFFNDEKIRKLFRSKLESLKFDPDKADIQFFARDYRMILLFGLARQSDGSEEHLGFPLRACPETHTRKGDKVCDPYKFGANGASLFMTDYFIESCKIMECSEVHLALLKYVKQFYQNRMLPLPSPSFNFKPDGESEAIVIRPIGP